MESLTKKIYEKIVYLPLDERPCNYDFCGFMVRHNKEIDFVRLKSLI